MTEKRIINTKRNNNVINIMFNTLCHICQSDTTTTKPCKGCDLMTCQECMLYDGNCSVKCIEKEVIE